MDLDLAGPTDSFRALVLVRLRPVQPDGSVVAESQRVCHLVPIPEAPLPPEFLTAVCGLRITAGSAEALPVVTGMPCEPCMASFPDPAFAVLHQFRDQLGNGNALL